MSTLYEITGDMLQLLALAEDPEADGVSPEVFSDTFQMLEMDFEDKADAYAKVIRELESRDLSIAAEINRLIERRHSIQTSIKRMKDALMASMVATDKRSFDTDLFSFRIQKNTGSVVIDDEKRLPDIFLIQQPPKIDKAGLKDLLKNEENAKLFEGIAHIEQTEGLRIR